MTKLVVILSFLTLFANGYTQEVRLGSNVWPPFTNHNKQKAVSRDLVKEGLARAGYSSREFIMDWDKVLVAMQEGDLHGSAAMWYTVGRQEEFVFSEAYLTNQLILVGRKGEMIEFTTLDQLQGKRLGIVKNYAYGPELDSLKEVEFVKGDHDQQNLNKLLKNEVDYVLIEALLVQYLAMEQPEAVEKHLEIGKHTLVERTLHFALHRSYPEADTVIARFNDELHGMMKDGIYHKILELNWIEADIDGDGKMELVLHGNKAGMLPPSNTYTVSRSLAAKPKSPTVDQRYFVEGKYYDNWNDIPQNYKVQNQGKSVQDMSGIKIKF